ncbi:MAG: sigma 54-interacting transcriptional regulator [Thermoanaerobacteraceae bacterium]|nr:sigma 54-interacting transcriptional regulator [Thermoanaerobacteraceae bacterium]
MEPRIAVMSYDRLTEAINRYIGQDELEKFLIINSSFEETRNIAEKLWNEGKADVFVSGSSNLQMIREKLNAPIVPIQISGFDIMDNLVKAKEYGRKVAIVTYKAPITNMSDYKSILNLEIHEKCYSNYYELKTLLNIIKLENFDAVIGSSLICDLCDEIGLNSIFIYSSNSIKNALVQAIHIQQSIMEEKYRSNQLNAVLNYAYSGIIATDEKEVIQIYNPMAEKIMGIPREEVIGKKVDSVIENTRLNYVLSSKKEEIDQIQKIKDKVILTSRIPIIVEDEVKGAVATFQDIKSIQKAEHKIRRELFSKGLVSKYSFDDIKGSSRVTHDCIENARQYARSDFTILITGESGTGKELFAHSIHNESERKDEAFVAVNCAALPENLLESELFGYEEGAFTGARKGGKMGLFELAHNGTIFLDEISEIPLSLQSRLLRVIQEKEVMRLGSDKIIPVDVRIISATNKDLWKEVVEGRFREDLYYRLSVLELTIPPLRERKADIPEIARDFIITNFPNLYSAYEKKWERIFKILQGYEFYGNVRELQNVLKRLSVLINSDNTKNKSETEIVDSVYKEKLKQEIPLNREQREINQILEILNESNWNKEKAARKLGISRTTLWRKLKTYGIE